MESPPDPASDPGNSASEPATPLRETPVNLETLRKANHPAPVRRQTCSSTNRVLSTIVHRTIASPPARSARQLWAFR
ncbi:unnamed protein product [Arctogadus glacialis]